MISHSYTGTIENPLSRAEAVDLTLRLGAAHHGDDYHNADVFGRVLHHGGVHYLEAERDRDPEAFAARIDAQIDELAEIIAPHVGRWVSAKHKTLGVKHDDGWDLWERFYSHSKVMHTSGVILGIAGVTLERRMIYGYEGPEQLSNARSLPFGVPLYRIGVLLDATHTEPAFCFGTEAPNTDRMLVPVRGLHSHRETFSRLWSWQLAGTDSSTES